jgi:hypothetical protein
MGTDNNGKLIYAKTDESTGQFSIQCESHFPFEDAVGNYGQSAAGT